jgi:SNW domain-containing protein 1
MWSACSAQGGKERVIRMVEAQVDILEPAKHKFKKVPRGPPSPPAPVLHSPPRKLTVADQASWKVPPCISNWKNARGYTIPLDKRLAADGRGLQETTINNKFASLTEALYVVERKAAEDIRIRNQVRKQTAMKDKEDGERELREMAARARLERSGAMLGDRANTDYEAPDDAKDYYRQTAPEDQAHPSSSQREAASPERALSAAPSMEDRRLSDQRGESDAERVAREQREQLRLERRKEREREARLENAKGRRGDKQDRDAARDVSEKIALGVLKGGAQLTGEGMFDSRLFNQSSGMDSGFGAEDDYNTYSKPLFARSEVANSIYRPKASDSDVYGDADAQLEKLQAGTGRFKADKGFRGTEDYASGGPRTEPVQFESGSSSSAADSNKETARSRRHDDDDDDSRSKRSRH